MRPRRAGSQRRLRVAAAALASLGVVAVSIPFAAGTLERGSEAVLDTAAPAPAAIAPATRSYDRSADPSLPVGARAGRTDTAAQASHDLVLRHAVASPPARPAVARWTLSHATTTSLS